MKKATYTLLAAAALLLAGCAKTKGPQYPFSIQLTDGTNSYQLVGNSQKMAQNGDRAYFDAQTNYYRNTGGQLNTIVVNSIFSTYNGNPQQMGAWVALVVTDTAVLNKLDPATHTVADRQAAMQQWLGSQTFAIANGLRQWAIGRHTDVNAQVWQQDAQKAPPA
jgi:uncharacterized lipoprotein YajG